MLWQLLTSPLDGLLLQNVCDLSNNMNGLRFPCFVKSGNAEVPYVLLKLPATESGTNR